MYNVDPARLGMEGFSDGATYALSVGASRALATVILEDSWIQ